MDSKKLLYTKPPNTTLTTQMTETQMMMVLKFQSNFTTVKSDTNKHLKVKEYASAGKYVTLSDFVSKIAYS